MTKTSTCIALLFSGVLLWGCSKENSRPEVIDSTVRDSGMDARITVAQDAKATKLSYKSWVVVDQVFATRSNTPDDDSRVTTRAAGSGTEISVLLTNRLKHSVDTSSVNHYKLAQEPVITTERKIGETYAEGYYITVVDSILVYKLDYGCFTEAFELTYQVAFYNDGVTRFKLPHKPYEGFSSTPYRLTAMDSKMGESDDDSEDRRENAYAWKKFEQTLTVDFDGSEYPVTATTFLKRLIRTDGGAYVVKSEVLSSEIVPEQEQDGPPSGAYFASKLKVRQVWSDGRDVEEEYAVQLFCELHSAMGREVEVRGDSTQTALQRKELSMTDDNDPWGLPNYPEFGQTTYVVTGELYLDYPAWGVTFDLLEYRAFYDDGVTYLEFPAPSFTVEGVTVVSDALSPMPNESEGWYQQAVKVKINVCGATVEAENFVTLHFI